VFVSQFLLAEAEERAKGWIHEEGLTFQILNCNPDGTRIENILEKLNGWCYVLHRASSSAKFPFPEYIALPIVSAQGRLFLRKLPTGHKFAIEIRNREWLDAEFANLLRDHKIALVLQDRSWMPSPSELNFEPITADWTYIRWLGNRNEIEAITQSWDKVVVDRTEELSSWVDFCYQIMKRGVLVYAYANNHFQGHGPATIGQFIKLWGSKGLPAIGTRVSESKQTKLFD
jgi:hypothetical protein